MKKLVTLKDDILDNNYLTSMLNGNCKITRKNGVNYLITSLGFERAIVTDEMMLKNLEV